MAAITLFNVSLAHHSFQSDVLPVSQMPHNSFAVVPAPPIPAADRLTNKHLYTCKKAVKREPLIVRIGEPFDGVRGHLSIPVDEYGFGYTVKGVLDSSLKSDDGWSLRQFESVVSFSPVFQIPMCIDFKILFYSESNLSKNYPICVYILKSVILAYA